MVGVPPRVIAKRAAQILFAQALMIGMALLAAGTWRWLAAWRFVGVSVILMLGNLAYVLPRNPGVIEARARIGEGTKRFDKIFSVFYSLGELALMAVCGLDAVRYAWSAPPGWITWLGLGLLVLANLPIAWAMGENPYLESTVRIQTDRKQVVITTGPYAIVRHPMYVGAILQQLAIPLALGSLWGLLVSVCLIAMLLVRTSLEDSTLRAELPGYDAYVERTRFRVIPGLW